MKKISSDGRMMRGGAGRLALAVTLAAVSYSRTLAQPETPFRYEDAINLDDMKARIRRDDPVGTPRDAVRAAFVSQGGGTARGSLERDDPCV